MGLMTSCYFKLHTAKSRRMETTAPGAQPFGVANTDVLDAACCLCAA
jgi:hypothetical protein